MYKMQNILEIKYKLEEQAKSAYSIASNKLDEQEQLLAQIETKKNNYEKELREQIYASLNVFEIKRLEDAVEVMKFHIKVQTIAVKNAKRQLELAKIKLKDAMIDRKTHEKLRENAFEEFMEEVKSDEKKEVDELVSFKYSRTSNSEE